MKGNAAEAEPRQHGGMEKLTETENVLRHAEQIARRTFVDPSEQAILAVFDALLAERERMAWATDDRAGATVH
ncbi:hypothetical protein ACLQ9J_04230 [Bordetella hinzii]|uniref:hypothetical protein n=1 Tax=Bordetella hinzii TaxID=103855 RepID=UPI0039FC5B4A